MLSQMMGSHYQNVDEILTMDQAKNIALDNAGDDAAAVLLPNAHRSAHDSFSKDVADTFFKKLGEILHI